MHLSADAIGHLWNVVDNGQLIGLDAQHTRSSLIESDVVIGLRKGMRATRGKRNTISYIETSENINDELFSGICVLADIKELRSGLTS